MTNLEEAAPKPGERLLSVGVGAALWLTACELLLIGSAAPAGEGALGALSLAPVMMGNWLPYAAAGALWLVTVESTARWLSARQRHVAWLAPLGALLVAPYAVWLASYTLSGPSVGAIPHRWAWLSGLALLICVGSAAVTTWSGLRVARARWALAVGFFWGSFACGALLLSKLYLPNEYEPLHAALGYLALMGAVLGAGELSSPPRLSKRATLACGAALLALAVASSLALSHSNRLAWVVWGQTPGSRYVTVRLPWGDDSGDDSGGEPATDATASTSDVSAAKEARRALHASKTAPHIFVFSIDNLQPDHVGAYGYRARPSTPNIDRLAARGTLFRRAYSYQPQTRVFMTSMLLGRRIPDFGAHVFPEAYQQTALTRTLATRDYYTLVKGVFELTRHRKFDPRDYGIDTNIERETPEIIARTRSMPHLPYAERFRIVEQHLKEAAGRPVFVWLHLLGPHWFRGSFDPSEDFPFGTALDALYDSAIAGTDMWLGRLEEIARRRLADDRDMYFIVMSDHGAGLTPDSLGREKGKSVLERHVHVPLIIAGPGLAVGEVDVPVDAALDAAATIADLAGIAPPTSYDGISLLPLLERRELSPELTERTIPLRNGRWSGAVYKHWKYVHYRGVDQLFDLSRDPGESENLADDEPQLVKRLRRSSKRQLAAAKAAYRAATNAAPDEAGDEQ